MFNYKWGFFPRVFFSLRPMTSVSGFPVSWSVFCPATDFAALISYGRENVDLIKSPGVDISLNILMIKGKKKRDKTLKMIDATDTRWGLTGKGRRGGRWTAHAHMSLFFSMHSLAYYFHFSSHVRKRATEKWPASDPRHAVFRRHLGQWPHITGEKEGGVRLLEEDEEGAVNGGGRLSRRWISIRHCDDLLLVAPADPGLGPFSWSGCLHWLTRLGLSSYLFQSWDSINRGHVAPINASHQPSCLKITLSVMFPFPRHSLAAPPSSSLLPSTPSLLRWMPRLIDETFKGVS